VFDERREEIGKQITARRAFISALPPFLIAPTMSSEAILSFAVE